jgi:hypothetical protein
MTRNDKWGEAKIRLLAVADGKLADQTTESLEQMLEEVRIEAEPKIIKNVDADTLAEHSAESSMVFLPFRLKDNQVLDPFGDSMENTLFLLPVTAMVLAAEDVDLDAEPEEGAAGEIAVTLDALEDSLKKARTAEKEAGKAVEAAQNARATLKEMALDPEGFDEEVKAKAEKSAEEAEKLAVKLTRKAAKSAAKAEAAAREAEAAGVIPEDPKEAPD